jgi:hypothetical protein
MTTTTTSPAAKFRGYAETARKFANRSIPYLTKVFFMLY